ncbi:MAG: LysR family transcriptional regulator [Ruminococcaceae bacterium]|nr:LysR family transcriptional regulator [Oscillospiraceae bacterium]
MDFRQLEYVITIAREGTISAAAEVLYLTPSALSQHIARLEEELRTPLFKRSKAGWIPTHAGHIYLNMARNILQQQAQAYRQIDDIADSKIGNFTVGVTPGQGTRLFSEIYPIFKEEFPGFHVGLKEGSVSEITGFISSRNVDIGFLTSELQVPGIISEPQIREDILLAVPSSHPLAQLADEVPPGTYASIDLKLLENEEFLLAGKGTTLRMLEDRAFFQAGFSPKVAFETTSLTTLNMLAQIGYGIAFVPRSYVDLSGSAVYFLTNPPAFWDRVVCYRKDHYFTKAEEYMISLANNFYRNLFEDEGRPPK